ncbi:MAG: biopolymer transporter ExbD [Myxococcales bacterium]|nr:biopolymer transporter ExbD [Myxococcales bacterium]
MNNRQAPNVPSGTGAYSHNDLTYVRRQRGRMTVKAGGEEEGELNIVPYLDIMINLIMFMLVAQTAVVSLGMIDITAPTYASLDTKGAAQQFEKNTSKLDRLTVGVAQSGFYIAAVGGVLPGETAATAQQKVTAEGVSKAPPTVPLLGDGAYNFRSLAVKMRGIKNAFPDTKAIYIAADDNIPYEVIVATLDSTREDDQGQLFPAVAFTQIN